LAFTFSLFTAITFLVLGRTSAWKHRFELMVGAQVAAALGLHVLGWTDSLLIMVICSIIGGANLGLGFFAATYYSLASARKKHGRLAINEAAVGFGGFLGSLAFGLLAERYGVAPPFVYSPLLIVAAIGLQYALLRIGWKTVENRSS
jgi:predicted MFS family arabinose efflux permease